MANVIYVNISSVGSNNGSDWLNAFSDLQLALQTSEFGDTIWVAEGVYYPTISSDRNISFEIKDGLTVLGGFNGNELLVQERNWTINKTILSGDIGVIGTKNDNSFNVVYSNVTNYIELNGFEIIQGDARVDDMSEPFYGRRKNGAGCYIEGVSASPNSYVKILNCNFKYNASAFNAGSIFINSKGVFGIASIIKNCEFEFNISRGGGAIYIVIKGNSDLMSEIVDCNFYRNFGDFGGAISLQNYA